MYPVTDASVRAVEEPRNCDGPDSNFQGSEGRRQFRARDAVPVEPVESETETHCGGFSNFAANGAAQRIPLPGVESALERNLLSPRAHERLTSCASS